MVLMHTEAREDLGACPSRNIKCSEITSKAILGQNSQLNRSFNIAISLL